MRLGMSLQEKECSMKAVEIFNREKTARDKAIEESLADFGIDADVRVSDAYYISGSLSDDDVEEISERLLSDALTQEYEIRSRRKKGSWIVEVRYKDNVSDPAEDSIVKAIKDLGKDAKAA